MNNAPDIILTGEAVDDVLDQFPAAGDINSDGYC